MSSQIAVYAGVGVDPFCLEAILKQLHEIVDLNCHKIIEFKDPDTLWKDPKSLCTIIVPGGSAAHMWESGWNHQAYVIKKYMENYSFSYYGICAGGILASSACLERRHYSEKNEFNNFGTKFLGLFPGISIAPIHYVKNRTFLTLDDFKRPLINYSDIKVEAPHILSPAFLDCNLIENTSFLSNYNGLDECHLLESSVFRNDCLKIEAQTIKVERLFDTVLYKEKSKGVILLTASHLEFNSNFLTPDFFYQMFNSKNEEEHKKIITSFEKGDLLRKEAQKKNFEKLLISCM